MLSRMVHCGPIWFFVQLSVALTIIRADETFPPPGDVVYVAQHNFKGTSDSDLPFKKGDKLKVLQE